MKTDRKIYTQTKKRKIILPAAIVLFAAVIFLAVISLLPNRGYYLGNTNTLGVGRSAMYPFAFTDSSNTLYVINENLKVSLIDDSVYSSVHDYDTGKIYYLRNSSLYEYSIEKNSRKELCADITSFSLLSDKKAILCKDTENKLKLYSFSSNDFSLLSDKLASSELKNISPKTGDSHIIFAENENPDGENITNLYISNEIGTVSLIAEDINIEKQIKISKDDKFVSFNKGNVLYITDLKGKIIAELENGKMTDVTEQDVLLESSTQYVSCTQTVPFEYFTAENDTSDLYYFKKKKFVKIDSDIEEVVILSSNGYCFYTKKSENSTEEEKYVDLYFSVGGTKPQKIITLPKESSYIYDELQGYIYFRRPDMSLARIYIKDRKLKEVRVAQESGTLSVYKNRPFVVYKDSEGTDTYIVLDSNVVEMYSENEIRMYGSSTNRYLIYKKNSGGVMVIPGTTSLDFYNGGSYTRISNNVSSNLIFFDKNFESILYVSSGKIYEWKDNTSTELQTANSFSQISPIKVIE